MRCPENTVLVDVVYGECATEDHGRILTHLEECQKCHERWTRLRAVLAAADQWVVPSASPGIAERALARIATERVRRSPADRPTIALHHLIGSLLFGAGAASLSLFLLFISGVHDQGEMSPLIIGLTGILWTALYGGVTLLALHPRYRRAAFAALVGAGMTMLVTPLLSMSSVIEASHRWAGPAHMSSLLDAVVFLAGILYASTPSFVSGASITRAARATALEDATWLAVFYALLVAPSVCLQCQHLALHLTVAWIAGMLAGAFLGSLGGVWVGARLQMATSG